MAFTKEEVEKILAGQEEIGSKVESILNLYNEDLNGLKMTRDDLKREKQILKEKFDELTAKSAKDAEDFAALQKQLEANSPDEIKKAFEQKQAELEGSYKGAISQRDDTIKDLTEKLNASKESEHSLKCMQNFNEVLTKYDVEPSSRDDLFGLIFGLKCSNFSERDLGNGKQLIDKDGRTVESSVRSFFETPFGKKFLKNTSTGGGAGSGSANPAPTQINPFKKETLNLTEQARLYRENPELYNQMKAAAGV